MPDDVTTAVVTEFEAESWPLEAAAEGLHQVIDGFQNGDTRPLVIGDGDQPVLVVLAIADLADFRARIAELLGNPVDAGWLRYYLRSNFDMSSETAGRAARRRHRPRPVLAGQPGERRAGRGAAAGPRCAGPRPAGTR